jgi:outer membrane protein OmpA-like peptidoglycan-associated protein
LKKIVINTLLGLSTTIALNAADCIMVKELNVEFKNASTVYSNASEYQEVKDYANFLKQTGLYALIEGHTSSLSGAKYNYDLSTRRAAKVRETLISLGVNPSQVKSMGYGESTPLYDNSTEDGEAKNRRVRGEVFNSASELNEYITSEKNRIASIKYQEQ